MPGNNQQKIELIDTTLRDGAQAPGVVLAPHQRAAIAAELARTGVSEIELGTPGMGMPEMTTIRTCLEAIEKSGRRPRTAVWCRAARGDVAAAIELPVDIIHVSVPASERHQRLTGSRDWRRLLRDCAELIADRGKKLSVGLMDASRAEWHNLVQTVDWATSVKAWRIRLADTVGVWHPSAVTMLLKSLRPILGQTRLAVHCHNDCGLAVGNAIAAAQAGAAIDVTVNGLGERAGNADLASVAMAWHTALGLDTDLDLARLPGLANLVATASRRPLPVDTPVVGEAVFSHESGLHVAGQERDQSAFQPIAPAIVGRQTASYVLGSHSGSTAVAATLQALGYDADVVDCRDLAAAVRARAVSLGHPLNDNDFIALIHQQFLQQPLNTSNNADTQLTLA